jgi:uncharacterized protein involved in exopolysaccharide biosynthesis/Mrp family chromosome partitioning ATPase
MENLLSAERTSKKNLRDVTHILFRHQGKAIGFLVSVVVLVMLYSVLASKIYRSEAELLVKIGRESVALDPTAGPNQIVGMAAGSQREQEVNSEIEILQSPELIGRVVDSVGVEDVIWGYRKGNGREGILGKVVTAPITAISKAMFFIDTMTKSDETIQLMKREKAIRVLLKNLDAATINKSNSIAVSYEAKSSGMAHDVLAALIDLYLDKHIQVHRTKGSFQFFTEQKERLRTALDQTASEIKELKANTNIASLEEQRLLVLKRIGYLKREIESTEAELAVSDAMVTSLRANLTNLPKTLTKEEIYGGALSAADEMRKRVNELELEESELLATFSEGSIPILEIRRQIDEGKALLRQTEETREVRMGINEIRQRIELNLLTEEGVLSSLRAKLAELTGQHVKAQDELDNINEVEHRLKQLELDREIQEVSYQKYAESLEQSLIDEALELVKISNIRVVQPATYPVKHVRPRKGLILVLGLLLGIFGGLCFAFVTETLDHSLVKPEDIETTLEFPALGVITCQETKETSEKKKGSPGVPLRFDAFSPIGKECDSLAERFLSVNKAKEEPQRVLSVTACNDNEGVSTLSAYLASSLSRLGEGRVLLVDANLQKPLIHRIFDVNLSPGLADLSAAPGNHKRLIKPSVVSGLDLLCAGEPGKTSGTKLFESKTFFEMLTYWKHEYSFVVIDTPALWTESYAASLGRLADGVIIVFEAEHTRWEGAQRARDHLTIAGANIIGGVLNKRRFHIPRWLYKRL